MIGQSRPILGETIDFTTMSTADINWLEKLDLQRVYTKLKRTTEQDFFLSWSQRGNCKVFGDSVR